MAMTMGQFLALASPGLDEIMHEDDPQIETQYTKVFKVEGLDELFYDQAKMAGFGSLVEIPEGGPVTYDEAIAPVTRRYEYVERGLGYKITQKFWMNDLYREVEGFERDLRRATDDDIEQFCFNMVNNATTTGITGFDGLALASTAHTRLDGGAVQANRPASFSGLSIASLQDAVIAVKKFKNERGRPFRSAAKKLLISVDNEPTAIEILGSSMRPDTANNATNAITRYGVDWMSSLYITSTTFAALIGENHDLRIFFRYRPKTDNKVDFETDTIHRKVKLGIARGFGEWRGFYLINT